MIHETAIVNRSALVGEGVSIWHWTHVREAATICDGTSIGQACYIDHGVFIGHNCRIQNGVNLYHPARVGDNVFVGPGAMAINDPEPRVGQPWTAKGVWIKDGASIGAGAILMPGVTIGRNAMVGAGALVTKDVPDGETWIGVPSRAMDR